MFSPKLRWFVLLGIIVFLIDGAQRVENDLQSIHIADSELESVVNVWQQQLDRKPTADEFIGILNDLIKQEILYREANKLGLAKGDRIIKRRLAQKMSFLKQSAVVVAPSEAELLQYYDEHQAKYIVPEVVSFSHLFFIANEQAQHRANSAYQQLQGQLNNAVVSGLAVDPFFLGQNLQNLQKSEIEKEFSASFYNAMIDLPTNQWSPPMRSYHGYHLIFIHAKQQSYLASFADIKKIVESDYLASFQEQQLEDFIQSVKRDYSVIVNTDFEY